MIESLAKRLTLLLSALSLAARPAEGPTRLVEEPRPILEFKIKPALVQGLVPSLKWEQIPIHLEELAYTQSHVS